jgi:hypothetical protein
MQELDKSAANVEHVVLSTTTVSPKRPDRGARPAHRKGAAAQVTIVYGLLVIYFWMAGIGLLTRLELQTRALGRVGISNDRSRMQAAFFASFTG